MIQNEFFSTICIEGKNERGLGPISTAIRWAPKNLMRIQEQGPRARRAFKKSSRNSYFQVVKKKISPPPSKGNEKTNNRPLRAPYCYSRKQCADDDKSWSGIPGSRIFSIPLWEDFFSCPIRLSHSWQADFFIETKQPSWFMASCGSERKLHYPSAKQITQPPGMLQGPTFPGMGRCPSGRIGCTTPSRHTWGRLPDHQYANWLHPRDTSAPCGRRGQSICRIDPLHHP